MMRLRGAEIYYCTTCGGWFHAVKGYTGQCDVCGRPLFEFRCSRCGHEWRGRTTGAPKVCPVCKSPYWNRARDPMILMRERKLRFNDYIGDDMDEE